MYGLCPPVLGGGGVPRNEGAFQGRKVLGALGAAKSLRHTVAPTEAIGHVPGPVTECCTHEWHQAGACPWLDDESK